MMLEISRNLLFSSSAVALTGHLHYCNEMVNCLDIVIDKMRF